jgi:CPA2 family monovalent cation:H+ antiporter-2
MEIPLLTDIVIILGLAVVVILIFQRFRIPTILGFLITGFIAGPYGLSLVEASHEVEILAEIGVILLLFIIGLEFSLKSLATIKKAVLLGGSLQVGLTILIVTVVAKQLNFSWGEATFLGFLFALSSTAIVLKIIQEKGEINTPHGKMIVAVLIFQDIIVVPMMLFTPLIAGEAENVWWELLLLAIKGILVIIFVLFSARYIVPWLLYHVARARKPELFVLSIVVICFSVAWLSASLGLSLALGAFLAGLIISESEYSHQATSNILPFREIFTSFFFVSIGMLLDMQFLFEHFLVVLGLTLLTFIAKGFIVSIAALILKYPLRTVILVGLSLFQVGEFSFILSKTGLEAGLLEGAVYQYFLSVSLMTMAATPFVIMFAHHIVGYVSTTGVFEKLSGLSYKAKPATTVPAHEELEDHLVIIGYGINGRNVSHAARNAGIPYLILELNPDTVKKEKKNGEPIMYGDAVEGHVLQHVDVPKARVVVIAISDPVATKRIIVNIRQLSPRVHIIVRTRFVQEMEENYQLGANEVIPEEFETSIEIFTRVLTKYLVPRDEIENFIRSIRAGKYEMLRTPSIPVNSIQSMESSLPDLNVATLKVQNSRLDFVNVPLQDSHIRRDYGINLIAINREGELLMDISGSTLITPGDILYVIGRPEDIAAFESRFRS